MSACTTCGQKRPDGTEWPAHWSARKVDGIIAHFCPVCSARHDQYPPSGKFGKARGWSDVPGEEGREITHVIVDAEDFCGEGTAPLEPVRTYDLACSGSCDGRVTRFFVQSSGRLTCSMCGHGLVEAQGR